jgi:hypothetical protein
MVNVILGRFKAGIAKKKHAKEMAWSVIRLKTGINIIIKKRYGFETTLD